MYIFAYQDADEEFGLEERKILVVVSEKKVAGMTQRMLRAYDSTTGEVSVETPEFRFFKFSPYWLESTKEEKKRLKKAFEAMKSKTSPAEERDPLKERQDQCF